MPNSNIKKPNPNFCCCSDHNTTDHRELGQKLEIFDFDSLIGPGLPCWLENGNIIREIIKQYVNSVQRKNGIKIVSTPELGKKELYETSGHLDHYKENIFPLIPIDEGDQYVLRPMTCPHHILLYRKIPRHENHLPIAFGENAKLYRYEYSGGLFGLERTRCMELIDTHMFCSPKTIEASLIKAWNIIQEVKSAFGIEYHSINLSLRSKDKAKFYDDDELWSKSESTLKDFLETQKIDFQVAEGDAAFYGPKIDLQIKTHLGKIITVSTIQLDFLLPQKFNLSYLQKEEGIKATPIMIHIGIIGTLERFISYLLERDNGWLPFWVSPRQIAIIPVNPEKHEAICSKLNDVFLKNKIRSEIMNEKETLSKKIAKTVDNRIYGHIVIGDKESEVIQSIIQTQGENYIDQLIYLVKRSKGNRDNLQLEDISIWKQLSS